MDADETSAILAAATGTDPYVWVRVMALLSRTEDGAGEPGEVLDGELKIACGEGAVRLLRVQREGKGPQDADTFLRGASVATGAKLS